MKSYSLDPSWIIARFASACQCGAAITKGQRVFYYPNGKKCLCQTCSEKASAEFQSAAQDEAFSNGQTF